ncbi:S1C family serine protease [Nocardioides caldifontis]|uniref:S1C family serine protease n=1 Tax=Nocardioides caldifontis TaxID=2588938 RepID=UPI0011DFFF98|nr:trypsin-like peptidase domain-containing protein [Nocardioides caldifontis]
MTPPGPDDQRVDDPTAHEDHQGTPGNGHPESHPYGPPPFAGPPFGAPPALHQPAPQPQPQPGWSQPRDVWATPGAPVPPPPSERRQGAVPGWVWPVLLSTALVFGLLGGLVGGAIVLLTGSEDGVLSGSSTAEPLDPDNRSVAAVAEKVLPSTVQIRAAGAGGDETGSGATGSGFVVDDEGHVITNNHVVEGAADDGTITVVDNDGRVREATIVGRSPVYDVAVLEVRNTGGLEPVALGSSRTMHVGETVVAIGSPLGLSSTVTSGIISAVDRPVTTSGAGDVSSYINAVQTDAAINPGNSGGPLVNLRGEVVGVNSAIATTGGPAIGQRGNIGVGFAIPMEQVRVTAQQILRRGEAEYPIIGADVSNSTEGATLVEVPDGTPADQAGLRDGDRVVAVEGSPVPDAIALIVAIRTHRPGETITLTAQRGDRQFTVDVRLDAKVG